ncbi:MAG: hypothetical protein HC850_04430 [Rhodomicrobium sp.]|nr:hypothetical protein [Rhodomicrobium sp.]
MNGAQVLSGEAVQIGKRGGRAEPLLQKDEKLAHIALIGVKGVGRIATLEGEMAEPGPHRFRGVLGGGK